MIKIKTLNDIKTLKKSMLLSVNFLEYLEKYFSDLHHSLGGGIQLDKFSLETHGYLVVLQPDVDNVRDLSDVGLNPEDNGLLGTLPEFVNLIKLCNKEEYFEVGVLFNNEFMMMFYYPRIFTKDPEVTEFLNEYLTEN